MKIKIGTRGSQLALWQAYYIEKKLQDAGAETEIITIETKGDKILDVALSKIGSKGVFTEELEAALRSGAIDIAVHSAKDVQSELPDDLPLIAFTEREQANDVLVSFNKEAALDKNFVIGTSSTRRVAFLKQYYPNCTITDMRGNLQTRFRKMEEGQCDAMLLAYAGVHRMKLEDHIVQHLDKNQFVPPVGQGAVTIQVSTSLHLDKLQLIQNACNHEETAICLKAERAFLKTMQGGCSIPSFAHATIQNETLQITGGILSLDGSKMVKYTFESAANDSNIGVELANKVLANGGKEILETIKSSK